MANEPGISSTVRSEQIANPSSNAPFTPLLVGEADLESGMASANEIDTYQRPSMAKKHFGDSNLGRNVIDAIRNGASEVMAVATPQTEETFDLASMSTAVEELPNAVKPDPEALSATVESSSVNVEITYEPLSEATLSSSEVYVNPSTREVGFSTVPSSGTLTYQAVDYTSPLDEVRFSTQDFDFIGVLNEHSSVVDAAVGVAEQRTDEQSPCVSVAGLEPMSDTGQVTLSNDTSRLRRVAPGRTRDGASLVGAFVGEESSIGLTTTVINQRVVLQDRPMRSFDVSEREQLIEAQVTPLKTIGTSAVIVDDVMAVSDDNTVEQNFQYGFSRQVTDYLIEQAHELEGAFLGEFNRPGSGSQLEQLLEQNAESLSASDVIFSYDVTAEIQGTSMNVTLRADVAEPIRHINNEFLIGNSL